MKYSWFKGRMAAPNSKWLSVQYFSGKIIKYFKIILKEITWSFANFISLHKKNASAIWLWNLVFPKNLMWIDRNLKDWYFFELFVFISFSLFCSFSQPQSESDLWNCHNITSPNKNQKPKKLTCFDRISYLVLSHKVSNF